MTPTERQTWVRRMGRRNAWWALGQEDTIEPSWEVVDAHLHLWDERDFPDAAGGPTPLRTSRYLLPELLRDTGSGHHVSHCVYIECGSGYRAGGPSRLKPVGEAVFAAEMADRLIDLRGQIRVGAAVCHADLRDPDLGTVLDAYAAEGGGLVRGVRQGGARLDDPSARLLAGAAPPGLYADADFRRGLASLGERGLAFDAFLFHFQLGVLVETARQAPGTTIVVNHTGAPIGYGGPARPGDPVFDAWTREVEQLADLPNLVMKLGGLASIVTGYDAHLRDRPPSSEEFLAERGAYFRHAIRLFGAERCMFESNFPVDSTSIGYRTLWNAYKVLAGEHRPEERRALLGGTARRTYRIGTRSVNKPRSSALHGNESRGEDDAAA
jgi:L-fuconolactonase